MKNNNILQFEPRMLLPQDVKVTKHAVERYLLRSKLLNQYNRSSKKNKNKMRKETERKIINLLEKSILIKINGDKELRNHGRYLFVVARKQKELEETITVITVMLNKIGSKELFSKNFCLDTVDYDAFGYNKALLNKKEA